MVAVARWRKFTTLPDDPLILVVGADGEIDIVDNNYSLKIWYQWCADRNMPFSISYWMPVADLPKEFLLK
jgi:hypothetical protein